MDKVKFKCRCGKKFQTKASNAGKDVKCPNCGAPNTVPPPPEETPSPPRPAKAPEPAREPKPSKPAPVAPAPATAAPEPDNPAAEDTGQPQARPGETLGMFMLVVPAAAILLMCIWFSNIAEAERVSKLHWLMAATIVVTAIFAAVEAIKLGMGKPADIDREGKSQSGPIAWFFFVVLLWPVCYPIYLRHRKRYKLKNLMFLGALIVIAVVTTYCFWTPGLRESFLSLYKGIAGLFTSGE